LTGGREHADWMNYLQEVSPAFESIQVGAPARLAITAPIDGQGVPLARPDAMVSWQKRSVAIKGPMRSIAALSGLKTSILYFLNAESKKNPRFIKENLSDLCASVQQTIIEILIDKDEIKSLSYYYTDIFILAAFECGFLKIQNFQISHSPNVS
jgi:hypothetical protein